MIPFNLEKVNVNKILEWEYFLLLRSNLYLPSYGCFFCVMSHDKRAPQAPGQVPWPNQLESLGLLES